MFYRIFLRYVIMGQEIHFLVLKFNYKNKIKCDEIVIDFLFMPVRAHVCFQMCSREAEVVCIRHSVDSRPVSG